MRYNIASVNQGLNPIISKVLQHLQVPEPRGDSLGALLLRSQMLFQIGTWAHLSLNLTRALHAAIMLIYIIVVGHHSDGSGHVDGAQDVIDILGAIAPLVFLRVDILKLAVGIAPPPHIYGVHLHPVSDAMIAVSGQDIPAHSTPSRIHLYVDGS